MSEVVAWLCIAFELFLGYMAANDVINQSESELLKYEAKSVFVSIASEQSRRVEEEKPTTKFLNTLNELIQTNVCHVIDLKDTKGITGVHNTGFIGYQDENFLYLHYAKTYKEIVQFYSQKSEQFPKSETMLLKELETEKLIDVESISNRRILRTKMKNIAGKSLRLLHLYKSSFNDNQKQKTSNVAEIIKPDFTKPIFRI